MPEQMHGMPLDDILIAVWFDGFTSGAATGCGLFLPGEAADAKADEIAASAAELPAMREQVRTEVRERVAGLMQQVEASGQVFNVSPAQRSDSPE